jgi:hypothetical protein
MVQRHKPASAVVEDPTRKGEEQTSVPRRRTVRPPLPFTPWEPSELAAARNISDNQQYDEINADKIKHVLIGRLKRIPYAEGKAQLGDLTDDQVLALRQQIAERRIAKLGDRAIVEKAEWPNPSGSRSRGNEEQLVKTA